MAPQPPMSSPPVELILTVLGSPAVGKSAITIRYLKNTFDTDYDPTINRSYSTDVVYAGTRYHLTIYDTAGCDSQAPTIPDQYVRNSHGYILVYSIADQQSFDTVKEIYRTLQNETMRATVPMVLVGNKYDLNAERVISYAQGQELAREWQSAFFETSALLGTNVSDIFSACICAVDSLNNNSQATTNQQQQQQQQQQRVHIPQQQQQQRSQQQPAGTRRPSNVQQTNKMNQQQQQQKQEKGNQCTIS